MRKMRRFRDAGFYTDIKENLNDKLPDDSGNEAFSFSLPDDSGKERWEFDIELPDDSGNETD